MRITLLTALVLLAGCSPPPTYYDELPDAGTDAADPADVDNSGENYGEAYSTKLTKLEFTGPPVADLNGIIAVNMPETLDNPIVILHTLGGFSADAGTAQFTASAGVKGATDDEFRVDPEVTALTVDASIDLESGEFSALLPRFNFVSWIEFQGETQRVSIPVTDLQVSGVLQIEDEDTATIPSGTWEGYVTKVDGDSTMVKLTGGSAPQPLTDLFSEQSLNFDTNTQSKVEPGSGDAWHVQANFTARSVQVAN